MPCAKTVYPFQEWSKNFSRRVASRSGREGGTEMRKPEFSKSLHPRNGIEGTHSELVRGHGLRQTKYRGLSRVRLSHYFMGAACNVKRYLNLLAFQMRTTALSPA